MANLDHDVLLQRCHDLVAAEMDGDLVMMSVDHGQYYGIGGIGPRLWALLEQPTSLDVLAQIICSEYQVDRDTCRKDLLSFVQELLDNGIVRLC